MAHHHHHNHVFSVSHARRLESRWRWLWQNPRKILGTFVRPGQTVVDMGCGPGFFTREAARLVGEAGLVLAVDSQQGMLDLLAKSVAGTDLAARIVPRQCDQRMGVTDKVDLILAFNVLHELPDAGGFFQEAAQILKPGGRLLIIEPPFRVSRTEFGQSLALARSSGFVERREILRVLFGRTAVVARE